MALKPIEIVIRAIGGDAVAAAFNRVAVDAQGMGRNLEAAGRGSGVALAQVESEAGRVDRALSQVGANAGLGSAADGARNLATESEAAATRAEELTGKLEKVRNTGAAIAAAGVGGLILSRQLSQVAAEGDAVEARLESILKQQGRLGELGAQNDIVNDVTVRGHFADDDEIRNAAVLLDSFSVSTAHMGELLEDAARQARTMGTDVSSVAQLPIGHRQCFQNPNQKLLVISIGGCELVKPFNVRHQHTFPRVLPHAGRSKPLMINRFLVP